MNETQKAELRREIEALMEGRSMQTKLAESILSLVRRVNTLTDTAITLAGRGRFEESDAIIAEVTGYSAKLYEVQGRKEMFPGCNSK